MRDSTNCSAISRNPRPSRHSWQRSSGATFPPMAMAPRALRCRCWKLRLISATGEIRSAGRQMIPPPIEPLPGVEDALEGLAGRGKLVLITKGDLFHQEQKLAA